MHISPIIQLYLKKKCFGKFVHSESHLLGYQNNLKKIFTVSQRMSKGFGSIREKENS